MSKILKLLGLSLLVFFLYIFFDSSCDEDSCCNGHGDYWLSSFKENNKTYTFFCETNRTDYETYIQAKKTYDYIENNLKNCDEKYKKNIIYSVEPTRKLFGCNVVLWAIVDGVDADE
jgi:hypothetical protein